MSPRSRTEFTFIVETLWVPDVVRDAVIPVKLPVNVADERGLEDNPESPVTAIVPPPLLIQVPLDKRVREEGIFQPLESPKYLVAPTVNSRINGV
jgi:hypothetical protein